MLVDANAGGLRPGWQEPGRKKRAAYWLALLGLLDLLSFALQDHLPRSGTTHSGVGPSTTIVNQENALTDLPTGQSDGDGSSLGVSFSQVTLICVKSTKVNGHGAKLTLVMAMIR